MGRSAQHLGLLLALLATAASAASAGTFGRHMLAGGCDASCSKWQVGSSCSSVTCSCVGNTRQVTWSATGTGDIDCKSSISWACCIKGSTSLATGNRCTYDSCSGTSAGGPPANYCNSVSSITYNVSSSDSYAIFYLHDGQFSGTVAWDYNGNSNSPCGGGGGGKSPQCLAASNVCEVKVSLDSICGSCSTPGPDPGPSVPSPSPAAQIASPSPEPQASPSPEPTASPSPAPQASPSPEPTASPSPAPQASPSPEPTASPSPAPQASPSPEPTASPSPAPQASPSPEPTASPSPQPQASPSPGPEQGPILPQQASPSPQPVVPPAPTCSSPVPFSCPQYTSAAPGSANNSPPNATTCCQNSCGNYLITTVPQPFPCAAGTNNVADYATRTNPTQNRCCAAQQASPSPAPILPQEETCSTPTLFQCPQYTLNKASAANTGPRVAEVCCLPTCGNFLLQLQPNPNPFPCQPGTTFVPGFEEKPNPSQEVCCAPNIQPPGPITPPSPSPAPPNNPTAPTCGNMQPSAGGAPVKYTCPVYTKFNDAASGTGSPSSTNCCLPQCGNYLSQDVANPETYPCSPSTVFNPLWATRDNPSQSRCCELFVAPESASDCAITSQGLDNLQMKVGQEVDVTLTVKIVWTENTLVGAEEVVVTNQLPSGLAYVGAALTDPDCNYVNNVMTCDLRTLPADAVKSFKVKVRAAEAGSYTNTASVSCKGDKVLENNSEQDKVTVLGACCDARAVAAATNYCSFRTEAACKSINGAFKKDKTCAEASCPIPEPPPKATCADSQPNIAGAPIQFACAPGTIFNTANADKVPAPTVCCLATCSNTDVKAYDDPVPFTCTGDYVSNPQNALKNPPTRDTCCKKDLIIDPNDIPDVSISKKVIGASTVQVGDEIQFELKVTLERGLAGMDNVKVTDTLPSELKFKSVTPGLPNCQRAGQEVKCSFKRMEYLETQTITITAIATQAGSFLNKAAVTGNDDADPKNNEDSEPFTVLGACCSRGKVTQRTEASCTQIKGTFYATRSKQVRCSTPTGSCCRGDGSCSIETATTCKQLGGKWNRKGRCSSVSCPKPIGACCISSLGMCLETTKENCAGVWSMGTSCSSSSCQKVCKPSFQPCQPGVDTCCDGNACKPIPLPYPGCSIQYACQPVQACSGEGAPCGDCKNGGACCPGLECKWDWWSKRGTCQKPKTTSCKKTGDSCSADGECCGGYRCGQNKKVISCDCNRSCNGDYGCETERKKDCASLQQAVTKSCAQSRHP